MRAEELKAAVPVAAFAEIINGFIGQRIDPSALASCSTVWSKCGISDVSKSRAEIRHKAVLSSSRRTTAFLASIPFRADQKMLP
jgi:hypothetical protein